jgi:hypothetical protein
MKPRSIVITIINQIIMEEEQDIVFIDMPAKEDAKRKRDEDDEILDVSSYLNDDWKQHLKLELEKPYFEKICKFLYREVTMLKMTIYPPMEDVFTTFNNCPLEKIKVVIIGKLLAIPI